MNADQIRVSSAFICGSSMYRTTSSITWR